jgi:hypothetical protein
MYRIVICLIVVCVALASLFAIAQPAQAQVAVTAYYPAAPVVTYLPERRGLFGQRLVYRPVVTHAAPVAVAPAPVTTYYAPAVRACYYAPAPVTTYYAPAVPVAPVTVYRPVIPAVVYP